jgi:HEAT repeat protein
MIKPEKLGDKQKGSYQLHLGRITLLAPVVSLVIVLTLILFFQKPRSFYREGRKFSFSVQSLKSTGPFADQGLWVRSGWDDPTGEFSHGEIYGLKLGKKLLRLDIVYDPIAAIRKGLPKNVPGLMEVLSSKDSFLVKRCAGEALVKMGPSARSALPALLMRCEQGDEDVEWVILELAKAAGASAVSPLAAALTDGHPIIRQKAAEALGEIGTDAAPSVPKLTGALHDPAPAVIIASALSLRKIDKHDDGEVGALIELLTNKDTQIRARAVFALGEFGADASEAVDPLMNTLETGDSQAEGLTARTLGLIGPAAQPAIPRIITMLDSDNSQTLMFSMEALGRFGIEAKAAIPRLLVLAERKEQMVGAISALSSMGADAMPGLLALYRHGKDRQHSWIAREFIKQGPNAAAAVPTLVEDLQSERRNRAATAAWALGSIGDSAKVAVPRLVELIHDDDPQVRILAAEALWRIDRQTNAVLPVMIGELKNWSKDPQAVMGYMTQEFFPSRQETAAEVLGEIGPPASEAVPLLQIMLRSSFDRHKQAAAKALMEITQQSF